MLNEKMVSLGKQSSVIRELFEYGKARKKEIGEENVFDFSIGNPSVPAPQFVNDTIADLIKNSDPTVLHGYTSAAGDLGVRTAIAEYIKGISKTDASASLIYMTCGAAASLTITLNAITNTNNEVILIAPFFPEYRVFAEKAGANVKVVPCKLPDFSLDFDALDKAINKNTKAIIVNSPNNPSGAVLSERDIIKLSTLLKAKEEEFAGDIFLISDEPYRELVYDNCVTALPRSYYHNTITCYSFSKSISLPGERIGYIDVSPNVRACNDVFAAICGAGRALGFVCAPSLLQFTVAKCLGMTADISVYSKNREVLYNTLTSYGYEVVKPDGAFYLFVKALEDDANKFSMKAREHELLIVPSDSFGIGGYVRISYCVAYDTIRRALPAFKRLYEQYKEEK